MLLKAAVFVNASPFGEFAPHQIEINRQFA
jgi:hypothetical protein